LRTLAIPYRHQKKKKKKCKTESNTLRTTNKQLQPHCVKLLKFISSCRQQQKKKKKNLPFCIAIFEASDATTQILILFRMHELTKLTNQFTNTEFKIEKKVTRKLKKTTFIIELEITFTSELGKTFKRNQMGTFQQN
jgi:hypothetical protein